MSVMICSEEADGAKQERNLDLPDLSRTIRTAHGARLKGSRAKPIWMCYRDVVRGAKFEFARTRPFAVRSASALNFTDSLSSRLRLRRDASPVLIAVAVKITLPGA